MLVLNQLHHENVSCVSLSTTSRTYGGWRYSCTHS